MMTATLTKHELKLENVHIFDRRFGGEMKADNPYGLRYFSVRLLDEMAPDLKQLNWPVRQDEDGYFLRINVGRSKHGSGLPPWPPMVMEDSDGGQTLIQDEDRFYILDAVGIESADLTIRPFNWGLMGKTGVKVYLESLLVRVNDYKEQN